MRQTLEPILDLLDEGLRLYRRSFAPLLLLASLVALPFGATVAAFFLAADWLVEGFGALLLGAVLIAGLPLSLYVMGALSRAALMTAEGRPVNLRRALAIGPLRALGMGCYGLIFSLVASIAVSTVSTVCLCIAYLGAAAVIGGAIAISSSAGAAGGAAVIFFVIVGVIVILAIYGASLVLNGAIYGSVIYVLQPLIHEGGRLGQGIRRSLDLLQFRFGQNLLMFLCASLVFSAAAFAATVAIGALIPLPTLFLLGTESNIARAITAAAWITGLSAAIPLLPIWMALLYKRRAAAREGEELAAAIAALRPAAAE